MGIVTDSTPVEAPKDPANSAIVALYRLFATPEAVASMEYDFRTGGIGYGEFKNRLFEIIRDSFASMRKRRVELEASASFVDGVLAEGAARARETAEKTMTRVRRAIGISA
jgi:tryptophanyl-tRNA synthetase